MTDTSAPDIEAQKDLLRRCWASHDAYWFSAVAAEFGIDAANRLNRANVRNIGRTEMFRLMKALGAGPPASIDEAMALFDAGRSLYVPSSLMEAEVTDVTPDGYDVRLNRCYVHENIVRAGIAGVYECAVFQRTAGWHDAWNMPLADDIPAATCAMAAGRACRQRFRIHAGEP